MKQVKQYIQYFIKDDFNWKSYLIAAFLMFLAIYFNYFSDLKGMFFSVEEKYSNQFLKKNLMIFWYIRFYGLSYLLVLFSKLYVENSLSVVKSRVFWVKYFLMIMILSVDGGFYFNSDWLKPYLLEDEYVIVDLLNSGHSFFTAFLLISFVYFIFDRKNYNFLYGLTLKDFNSKPYLIMLLMLVPIVFYASTTKGFNDYYPITSPTFIQEAFGLSKRTIFFVYEFVYLFDFLNLELLMRGLMVIGMSKILGKHAILPATMVYLLLHFEKPIAEAIGSIFGGYILSIIAFRTQSILGGIIVHMGIAALMEFFGFL